MANELCGINVCSKDATMKVLDTMEDNLGRSLEEVLGLKSRRKGERTPQYPDHFEKLL